MPTATIIINNKKYEIKIAHKIKHRELGLQGVDILRDNEGVLFIWGETRYPNARDPLKRPFVSMCVPMDLTVIFLDDHFIPVEIKNGLSGEPGKKFSASTKYYCSRPASMMLELNGELEFSLDAIEINGLQEIVKKYPAEVYLNP